MRRLGWIASAVVAALCCCFAKPSQPHATGDAREIDVAFGTDAPTDSSITVPMNIMFVTSMSLPPGSLGGVTGADTKCTMIANGAGLQGHFMAWLSTGG